MTNTLIQQPRREFLSSLLMAAVPPAFAKQGIEVAESNNSRLVDLSDIKLPLPLVSSQSKTILTQSEDWELSSYKNSAWPNSGRSILGYPSVVKNIYGENADGRFYLYYAHHDPTSGIGCAVSSNIDGPYKKLRDLSKGKRLNSMVLQPYSNAALPSSQNDPSHLGSPCVIWNPLTKKWHMYFHFYNHNHRAWSERFDGQRGFGHQMTGLAICADLGSHRWSILKDKAYEEISWRGFVPVLPTSSASWINSQSTYHSIHRLPDGKWLALIRGTSANGRGTKVGFAESQDGISWTYDSQNPMIDSSRAWSSDTEFFRPGGIALQARHDSLDRCRFLVIWLEGVNPKAIYATTDNMKRFKRDPRGYSGWQCADGALSLWRENQSLFVFSGALVHRLQLESI